jgi:thioredoxin 2
VIRVCPSCGQKNRIPPSRLHQVGYCGVCKAELPPTNAPIDVDQQTFDQIVKEVPVPVLVDFWAEWCAPCRMAAPEVKKLAEEMAGRALVLKVNTEKEPALAARYNIRAIPNFLVLRGGQVVSQQAGLADHRRMKTWLEQGSQAA